ncbi:MAG: hypothetical protein N2109_13105, partial [Fimbriimonadales bacterium]|nr:hypothetical protein [Fimbriimonadales bacterium]
RFVTPLVHPHVFQSGEVCTGYARSVSEFLDLFVVRLYNLIRWDPSLMNPHSPADHGALLLWESGSIRCPLDEPLVLTSDDRTPAPAMEWTDL